MTTFRRRGAAPTATLLGLVLIFVAAHAVAPRWSRDVGLDVWNFPAAQEQLQRASEEEAEVLARGEQSARRHAAAAEVVLRLADGLPLAEATDELMELLGDDTGTLSMLSVAHRDAPTLRHAFALHAIERFRRAFEDDPARRDAVLPRLEAEYRQLDASPEPQP
jgi:hypothetical protein